MLRRPAPPKRAPRTPKLSLSPFTSTRYQISRVQNQINSHCSPVRRNNLLSLWFSSCRGWWTEHWFCCRMQIQQLWIPTHQNWFSWKVRTPNESAGFVSDWTGFDVSDCVILSLLNRSLPADESPDWREATGDWQVRLSENLWKSTILFHLPFDGGDLLWLDRAGFLLVFRLHCRKYSELSELNVKVREAVELHNKLVNEAPFYATYNKMQAQYAPPAVGMQVRSHLHSWLVVKNAPNQAPRRTLSKRLDDVTGF